LPSLHIIHEKYTSPTKKKTLKGRKNEEDSKGKKDGTGNTTGLRNIMDIL